MFQVLMFIKKTFTREWVVCISENRIKKQIKTVFSMNICQVRAFAFSQERKSSVLMILFQMKIKWTYLLNSKKEAYYSTLDIMHKYNSREYFYMILISKRELKTMRNWKHLYLQFVFSPLSTFEITLKLRYVVVSHLMFQKKKPRR